MEEVKEKINWEIRRRSQILDAEEAMVDLLHKEKVQLMSIPDSYFNSASTWLLEKNGVEKNPFYVLTKEEFHAFYNWLREVGRDEPEL